MNSELQQEQKRVDGVMETITEEISRLEEETTKRKNEVVHIRKHFWDEVKVNTDTFDDYLETIIGLRQEAQALSVNQSTHRHASKRLSTLRRMNEVPYFGRIDFIEAGDSTEEQIYIGISSLSDTSGENFLIYDWRAPISSVYYDYQPGEAQYITPEGPIEGVLEKKWQYLIRDGILQSMFDTSLTIGDEILQQVLGKGTDKQMHNIVATIQQEQNRIIRHDKGRLLIVHGAAGSGKTSAALQRIAYLLYKYREHLNADQIILFSPNSMFSSYVSNVLPELGEENMQQVTFQQYLVHRLSKEFEVENPYDQLEYVLTATNTPSYRARLEGIRFKASTRFFEAIQSYRQSLELSGLLFKDINFRGKPIITSEQIANRFYSHDTALRFHSRLEKLKDWLIMKLKEIQRDEREKPWVQEEIELLSNEDYHKAHRFLAEKRGFEREAIADYEIEPEALARLIVSQKLKPLRKRVRAFHFVNFRGVYTQLFADPLQIKHWLKGETPAEWTTICQTTVETLDEAKLFYEDATPFLLLKELILGFQTNRSIKHIVVDEAQDYSPFQFEFLRRLFPAARMTVLGDFNQAIFAHASEKVNFNTLTDLYGPDETELINIARSYRSTKPIIEFTRRLVLNGERIIPFERPGERPALIQVTDHVELHSCIASKVTELRSQGFNSIAIICKSAEESIKAYESLSSIEETKLLKSSSIEYEQGVVVIPSYLAKGIEFDAVIIYDASEHVYGDESLRRIFYTACTRAMHDLQLYSVGEPSPFLRKSVQDGFIFKINK
ncbi:helicase [Alkalihalobacillus alcalophilus ATCC 27647 = CGMCC 1.3604]|uniref:Helicase n=1 Tax=Alkalihalobacillus alcalophilus ATCC 27647 = CGMCC 1.3604 TaxID=1218173 RepID=A0A094XD01_ALKAL|nr:RNA polymerase recycling motor HelD [Alkalihalobacillus alcalophilus]KGA96670.1 helicase [Alkalihalobacillus alcalophilus ATCC 27647 = CGMCC 1.3604]MED1561818.1 RNA polymerase recycling motor HelD [Alkalihalobacillus alcalophilus]THG90985.1 helicase [Alkalihalobacillus alcalophilus ATCC 27647 = CGMCC 1.3604]